ncbi:hypothetical protein WJX72_007587 [[Myrmecia] bisecta]|uniref:Methyltransferase FkbM domain-containing protein n=1 Tax=[Myrmecia] bisecta TaxID=41462 RepID=A0AAW1QAF9_9CHLO
MGYRKLFAVGWAVCCVISAGLLCSPYMRRFRSGAPVRLSASANEGVKTGAQQPEGSEPLPFPWEEDLVERHLESSATVEVGLTQIWYKQLHGRCVRPGAARSLVLDIGANFGWYSLFAASLGCRVIAWEPVPHFRAFFEYAVRLNGLAHLVAIRPRVVADEAGNMYELTVPQRGIWGTASVGGGNIDRAINNEGNHETVLVEGERVDAVVRESVLVMKLDVEGFEPTAFEGAKGLLDSHEIHNLFMEVSPGVVERQGRWDEYPQLPKMLMSLLEHGFTMLHIRDDFTRDDLVGRRDAAGTLRWEGAILDIIVTYGLRSIRMAFRSGNR